jgi:Pectate lyase superfamily protein
MTSSSKIMFLPSHKFKEQEDTMFDAKRDLSSLLIPIRSALFPMLISALSIIAFCPGPAFATVRNVTDPQYAGGAIGNGINDDTPAIDAAIGAMQAGDTLYFPCTSSGSTYLISSQLTISLTNGVPLSNVTVEGDPSGCVTIKDEYAGPYQQAVMLIGGDANGNPNPRLGTAVPLSATANELATSFATSASLGVSAGDYVYLYLCQGGVGGNNGGTSTVCGTQGSLTVTCDPSGCRGEVLKVASVSGNTITVTTALHDTYVPSSTACTTAATGNCATVQKIVSPLIGVTVQNLTFSGIGHPYVVKAWRWQEFLIPRLPVSNQRMCKAQRCKVTGTLTSGI